VRKSSLKNAGRHLDHANVWARVAPGCVSIVGVAASVEVTMRSPAAIPPVPLLLGLGGLIPFVGLSVLLLAGLATVPLLGIPTRPALLLYGAVITSFLGGIRWGLSLKKPEAAGDYVLSVVPSLAAWACLALPRPWDVAALGILLLAWGLVDQDLPRRGLVPSWVGRLRLILSGVAGLSLLAAAG
jgi:hypothetical protein